MIRTSIPVLCYHNVSDVDGHSPERFREHLDAIADAGYRTISARELLSVVRGEMKAPRKSVVLTFDDGHISNWLTVVPELEKRDMTGTFFALTDFTVSGKVRTLNNAPGLHTMAECFKAAHRDNDFSQFINEGEIKAMLGKGMEVFSHGCSHQGAFRTFKAHWKMGDENAHWGAWTIYPGFDPKWPVFKVSSAYIYNGFWPTLTGGTEPKFALRPTKERLEFCRRDFRKSLERMRDLNGFEEQLFCWPWGQFCEDAEAELKKAGYVGAFSLERFANTKGTNPFRLNRIGVAKVKDGRWIQSRLAMYGSDPAARVFFKFLPKRTEIKSVLYATDSVKLSGGSRQLINNISAMSDMGIKTYALLSKDSPIGGELDGLNVEIIEFDRFSDYFHAGSFLKKLIREKNIDVVHSFHNRAYKMGVLARLMGAKFKLFINRGVISRPNDLFFLWTALANGVITNSMQCAAVLKKYRVMKSRLNVVYNAYCGPDLGAPKPHKKRGARFAYVGNSAEIKGFDIFLQAAARFCETGDYRNIDFIGVGISEEDLDRFGDHLTPAVQERLHVTGTIPHAQVLEELRFSDILIVPSRKESLPNALLEGFDFGLPAICTSVGGIPEVVKDGLNGYLCDNEDAECIAEKMRILAEDPSMRFNVGCVGRMIVRTLMTQEAKGRNLMRVYMGETLCEELSVEDSAKGLQLKEQPYEQHDH